MKNPKKAPNLRFHTQPVMPDKEKKRIKLMAAVLRYPIGVLIIFQSLFWAWVFRSRFAGMLSLGLGMTCLGIYEIIGYRLRFRHIYCANQNLHRRKMTPDDCDWDTFPKSEGYGLPALEIFFGTVILVVGLIVY